MKMRKYGQFNIQEVYSSQDFIEEILKSLLRINISEYTVIPDGSVSYTVILASDLDISQREILKQIGFEVNSKGDLWISERSEFDINDFKNPLLPFLIDYQKNNGKSF